MAVGIIAEFNPFHNGHKYLIAEAKRRSGCDTAVAVMSGEWVQRGGIAITDKWIRAKQALLNGIDLVLELPVIYSMNTAQKFAYGAIGTLTATGVIDTLAFGSESGDANTLLNAADLLINEPAEISDRIKTLCGTGMTYAAARAAAYAGIIDNELLSAPNDILATEYIRAMDELDSDFDICAIKRKGAAHDSDEYSHDIASASEIRRIISDNGDVSDFLPCPDFPVYNASVLDAALIAKLRSCGAEYLRDINDVSEGLENRFIKAAAECDTADELCMTVKSKRYALSRIRRIAWSSLLGIAKSKALAAPSYIRVLGMTERGITLLKQMKTTASLPVIIKPADYPGDDTYYLNSRAEDIFALCAPDKSLRRGGRDMTTSPVIIR